MILSIISNTIGAVYEFGYNVPLRGLTDIVSYSDVVTGETGNRFWKKEFSYTLDGVNYTDWELLDNSALQALVIPIKNDFLIKFKYTHEGTDISNSLTIDEFVINGNYSLEYLQLLSFHGTILEKVSFTDEYFNRVWLNLLEKYYEQGIIPRHIVRGDDTETNDEDYIFYWKSQVYLFAALMALRKIEVDDFFEYSDNIVEYMFQRSFFVCGTESLSRLKFYLSRLAAEINERGTELPYLEDGSWLNQSSDPDHGEARRMICYRYEDEFLYDIAKNHNVGWCIGNTSPMYTSTAGHKMLNKLPIGANGDNRGPGITDISQWQTTGTVLIYDDPVLNDSVLEMSVNSSAFTPRIKVDHTLGYEITCRVKKTSSGLGRMNILINGFTITDLPESLQTYEEPNNDAAQVAFVEMHEQDLFYELKGYIYPSGESTFEESTGIPQDPQSSNLRFTENVHSIQVLLYNQNTASPIQIYDLKMTPMVYPNTCYINAHAFVTLWANNRNNSRSMEQIIWDMRRYIIPYNSLLRVVSLERELTAGENELYAWLIPVFQPWNTRDDGPWLLKTP